MFVASFEWPPRTITADAFDTSKKISTTASFIGFNFEGGALELLRKIKTEPIQSVPVHFITQNMTSDNLHVSRVTVTNFRKC